VREFFSARKIARKQSRQHGNSFRMQFKSLRKANRQSIPLGARSVKFAFGAVAPAGFKLFPKSDPSVIPFANPKRAFATFGNAKGPSAACRLVYDRGRRTYELHVPLEHRRDWAKPEWEVENQDSCSPRVIALDPGVRVFQSGYSPSGELFESGSGDAAMLCKAAHKVDSIKHKMSLLKTGDGFTSKVRCRKRQNMRRAVLRCNRRVCNMISEVHWKTAHYLTTNFDVILIPEFATQQMIRKHDNEGNWRSRRIGKSAVRRMVLWSHYTFRQRLRQKAKEKGVQLVVVNEAYTSKTCTRCGKENRKLGGSKTFRCGRCHLVMDRDAHGARNILLRNTFETALN